MAIFNCFSSLIAGKFSICELSGEVEADDNYLGGNAKEHQVEEKVKQ